MGELRHHRVVQRRGLGLAQRLARPRELRARVHQLPAQSLHLRDGGITRVQCRHVGRLIVRAQGVRCLPAPPAEAQPPIDRRVQHAPQRRRARLGHRGHERLAERSSAIACGGECERRAKGRRMQRRPRGGGDGDGGGRASHRVPGHRRPCSRPRRRLGGSRRLRAARRCGRGLRFRLRLRRCKVVVVLLRVAIVGLPTLRGLLLVVVLRSVRHRLLRLAHGRMEAAVPAGLAATRPAALRASCGQVAPPARRPAPRGPAGGRKPQRARRRCGCAPPTPSGGGGYSRRRMRRRMGDATPGGGGARVGLGARGAGGCPPEVGRRPPPSSGLGLSLRSASGEHVAEGAEVAGHRALLRGTPREPLSPVRIQHLRRASSILLLPQKRRMARDDQLLGMRSRLLLADEFGREQGALGDQAARLRSPLHLRVAVPLQLLVLGVLPTGGELHLREGVLRVLAPLLRHSTARVGGGELFGGEGEHARLFA